MLLSLEDHREVSDEGVVRDDGDEGNPLAGGGRVPDVAGHQGAGVAELDVGGDVEPGDVGRGVVARRRGDLGGRPCGAG